MYKQGEKEIQPLAKELAFDKYYLMGPGLKNSEKIALNAALRSGEEAMRGQR